MVVLDIGGTKIAVARWVKGTLRDRKQIGMPAGEGEWRLAIQSIAEAFPDAGRLGVAVTGSTDGRTIKAINQNVISYWNGYPLAPFLQELWGCPVLLLNDAQAAAWGEFVASGRRPKNLLFITLSTGVGGGLVLNGGLFMGHLGLAGHVGHVSSSVRALDGDSLCGCGRLNCIETVASGAALSRQATHITGTNMDAAAVFAGFHAGDPICLKIISTAALAVAHQIADVHATLGLEEVRVGGGVGLAAGMIEAIVAAQKSLPLLFQVPIRRAALQADAGLIGVGHWVDQMETSL
jgi:N-acylmannosamine kinase